MKKVSVKRKAKVSIRLWSKFVVILMWYFKSSSVTPQRLIASLCAIPSGKSSWEQRNLSNFSQGTKRPNNKQFSLQMAPKTILRRRLICYWRPLWLQPGSCSAFYSASVVLNLEVLGRSSFMMVLLYVAWGVKDILTKHCDYHEASINKLKELRSVRQC